MIYLIILQKTNCHFMLRLSIKNIVLLSQLSIIRFARHIFNSLIQKSMRKDFVTNYLITCQRIYH